MKYFIYIVVVFLVFETAASDWETHKSELLRISAEIERHETELKELLNKKKREKRASPQLLKDIEATHRRGEKALKEHNKEVEHIKYRHPGREAEQETRSYSILNPRTIEDYESDIGVDGKLDKIKAKMNKQYGSFSTEKEQPKPKAEESEVKKDEPQRIRIKK